MATNVTLENGRTPYSFDFETLRGLVSDDFPVFNSNNMDSDPTSNVDDPRTSHASIDLLDAHMLLAGISQYALVITSGHEVVGDYQNHVGDYHR